MSDLNEIMNVEEQETPENIETTEAVESVEVKETPEDTKKVSGKLGYSSEHYQWEMANAIKNNNQIAYDNAKRNYANAKAREEAAKVHY